MKADAREQPIAIAPEDRLTAAAEALGAMQRALDCIDSVGAHACGARLDMTIHQFRKWCAGQRDLALLSLSRTSDD